MAPRAAPELVPITPGLAIGFLKIPCIIAPAEANEKPTKNATSKRGTLPSQTMDWTATFVKLSGAKARDDRPLDGIDLMPALRGGDLRIPRGLFFRLRGPYRKFIPEQRAVRLGDWKYIEGTDGSKHVNDLGKGPYLFNLARDPFESTNLADSRPLELNRLMKGLIRALEHHRAVYPVDDSGNPLRPKLP